MDRAAQRTPLARCATRSIAALFPLLALGGCRERATSAQCTEMLDRYLTLTSQPSDEFSVPERQAGAAYLRASRQCATEVSTNEYRCAMRAPSANAWEACID